MHVKKPLVASMSDVAGSGGYYIAMGAKKIIAAPGTLTGSIGVIGGKMVTRGLYDKLGLNDRSHQPRGQQRRAVVDAAFHARRAARHGPNCSRRPITSSSARRPKAARCPMTKLDEVAQGRVYTGRMAKKLGLVDELGTLDDAIAAAKVAAGLKADAEVDLLILPEQKTFFEQLFGDPSATTDLDGLLPDGLQILRQAAVLRQLLSARVLLWMPYRLDVE